MFLSAKRPFYQSTQTLAIDKIDKDEYYDFAYSFFDKQKRKLTKATFDYLHNQFDGHTWYIQIILNRLYGISEEVGMNSVNEVITEIVSESTYAYENLLAAYSSGNVKLLKAIAKAECVKEINSGAFIGQYNLRAASSVNYSLKKLLSNDLYYTVQILIM
jgi:uncharacterized protein